VPRFVVVTFERVAVFSVVDPSLNVMVPDGVPLPVSTIEENVTLWPYVVDAGEFASSVVVLPLLMVTVNAAVDTVILDPT
jgi:hypothetical protein